MTQIPFWLDTDTGVDDAFALLAALYLKNAEMVGASAVAGNVTHDKTFRNARNVLAYFGHPEIPVYPGAEQPLEIPLQTAAYIHGNNGLGGVILPDSDAPVETSPAWEAIYEAACAHENFEIVAVGPLTNIAILIQNHPDIKDHVKQIRIMGGVAQGGTWSVCGEFNICVDPHAAEIVFQSGIPIMMFGIDVTMKASVEKEDIEAIEAMTSKAGRLFADCMDLATIANSERFGRTAVAVHDVLPVLSYDYPELFNGVHCGVHVETAGVITSGMTVTDIWSAKKYPEKNAEVMLEVDREAFIRVFKGLLARI